MTSYACEKPCRYCVVTGRCPRIPEVFVAAPATRTVHRYQNEDATLKCGDTIPWPIIQAFGQHIHGQVWCSVHGWQPKITKADIEKARKARRKAAAAEIGTFDDVPPF